MNAIVVPDRGRDPEPSRRPRPELGQVDEPNLADAKRELFRIQYTGKTFDGEASILKEVEIQVVDKSSAIVAAANLAWPPRTSGVRILDHEGREVFGRHKRERR